MNQKRCPECDTYLQLSSFYKDKSRNDGLDAYCKKCRRLSRQIYYYTNIEKAREKSRQYVERNRALVNKKRRLYHSNNQDKVRRYRQQNQEKIQRYKFNRRMRQYGLTAEQYYSMLAAQNNCCKICESSFEGKIPRIDHCHLSLKVRGLLCDRCNRCLGLLQDDPVILDRGAEYLRKYGANN